MMYNIAIIPPRRIEELSIAISKFFYDRGGKFFLDSATNFPHITIAHFECNSINVLHAVISECVKNIGTMVPSDVIQNQYRVHEGWIDMSFEINEQLSNMYHVVLQILQDNKCQKTSDDWNDNAPHITLSRLKDDADIDLCMLSQSDFSFIVERIGIFELGKYGTNKKIIKQFILN